MATCKDFSRTVTGGSDEVKDILCEPCEQDGRQTDAEGFCVNCSEYLCGQCFKNHKLFKAFRNHELQDKDSMPKTAAETAVKDLCLKTCDQHSDKVVEYYCGSCDKVGCTTCITLDHRQCENVEHIPKMVRASDFDQEFHKIINKVDTIFQEVQERKNALKSLSSSTGNIKSMAKTELKRQRAEIDKFLDDLEKDMDQKIDDIDNSNTAIMTSASEMYDKMDKELAHFKTDVCSKQNLGQQCEAFIAMKHSALDIVAIEKQFQDMQKESQIQKYKLLPSSEFQDITEICRMETETVLLGTDITQAAGIQQSTITTESSNMQDTTNNTTKMTEATKIKSLRLNTEINISTNNDQQSPYARGLAVVQGHYIVVADRPNNSVKMIDLRDKKVTSELAFERTVWNVTKVSEDKIAVGMKSAIQFLSVSNRGYLHYDVAFETKMTCFDVVYCKGKLIAAQGSFVEIIDLQGKVLKTIESGSEGGQFISCYGVAISNDNETIYVSDNTKNTVTSMTFEGKVKAIYTDTELKNPWGITVDNGGNVYVCSCGTKCIHVLSADCNKLQVFPDMQGGSITWTDTNNLLVGGVESFRIYDLL